MDALMPPETISPITRDDVTAVLVTRGDHDLTEILDSLIFPRVVVWDNSVEPDFGAYGRYAAMARNFMIGGVVYTADDDCLVYPWVQQQLVDRYEPGVMVSNMNPNHNAGMPYLALPGYGSIFDWRLPGRAFKRWQDAHPGDWMTDDFIRIGADIIFPVLTPSKMVHLGWKSYDYAYGPDRTFTQPGYVEKKNWYYAETAKLREAT